jgi:hypothetical protein
MIPSISRNDLNDQEIAISEPSQKPLVFSLPPQGSLNSIETLHQISTSHHAIPPYSTNLNEMQKEYWGDDIRNKPESSHHRIYFQNLDGMRNDSDEIDLYISSMAKLNVDTICWADPGLDFSQKPIRHKVQVTFQNHFKKTKIVFSSCQLPETFDHRSSGYQPGGTLTATTGRWVSRTNGTMLADPSGMGRWSGITFIGKDGKSISIITGYRSPRQSVSGCFGFYDQQHATLLSQGKKSPNVRKQFISDFTIFIQELQAKRKPYCTQP